MLAEPKLAIILQPLLRAQRSGAASSFEQAPKTKQPPGDGPAKPSKKAKRRANQLKAQEEAAKALDKAKAETARAQSQARAAKAGGGKGAGGAGKAPSMPKELIGKARIDAGGRRMCYAFNMACGCTKAQPGQSCDRGYHGCMEPLPDGSACGKPHCMANH